MTRYRDNPEAIRALVRGGEVHRDVYTDPELFDLEMERLWRSAWIYVGHDSQVPRPGDYLHHADRRPAAAHGALAPIGKCACSTTDARIAAHASSARLPAIAAASCAVPIMGGPTVSTGRCAPCR